MKRIIFILIFVLSFVNIYSSTISSCNTTITVSGDYNLTSDIGPSTENCIDITSSNVNLNCLGNTIIGNGSTYSLIKINHGYNNITITNCNLYHSFIGIWLKYISDSIDDISIDNITFSNNSYPLDFEGALTHEVNNFKISNSFFSNSLKSIYIFADSRFKNSIFENLFMVNSSVSSFETVSINANLYSNNTFVNVTFDNEVISLGVFGINDFTFINSTFNKLTLLTGENNTFIGNTFLNVSEISISSSPNNFTGNTYYNETGDVSSVCFFGGLVCDNSATVLPFAVEAIISAAVSVTSLPSFGFWSVTFSVLVVFVGLLI